MDDGWGGGEGPPGHISGRLQKFRSKTSLSYRLLKNSGNSTIRQRVFFFLQKYWYSLITTEFGADMLTAYVCTLHKYVYLYRFICMVRMYILNILKILTSKNLTV